MIKKKDTYKINTNCNWYYQVQGQLHVSKRKQCIFAIWGGENRDLKVEYIERDDVFWSRMEKELVDFNMQCMLPEIVDSRRNRGMPIRDGLSDPDLPPIVQPVQQTRDVNFAEF